MVKEVAEKTSDIAGDGTTTATVLAEAIYREGLKNVTAGADPMALQRGMQKACDAIVADIKKMAKPCKTKDAVAQIGAIAANGDSEIGDMIAKAMDRVGTDGGALDPKRLKEIP